LTAICNTVSLGTVRRGLTRASVYLIASLSAPFDHFRDSLAVHASPRLSDGIDHREVRLKRVERRNSVLTSGQSSHPITKMEVSRHTA
jgi:hypothetical protein